MRIVQLIDSLDIGGGERMAVNYANALARSSGFSALVATRKQGALRDSIAGSVNYLFLRKSGALDFAAVLRLRTFCIQNSVTHIQAHGTSYFTGLLLRLALPKIRLVWHIHSGKIQDMQGARLLLLRLLSRFFWGVIAVNRISEEWAKNTLASKRVKYLPNFVTLTEPAEETPMQGTSGKRALIVANLREPKGHMTLLQALAEIKGRLDGWSFHLVGKDHDDSYSRQIKTFIIEQGLQDSVYLYGSRKDSAAFIRQADLALMSSDSEGLPLALLEYGIYGKAVLVTAVGEVPNIVEHMQNGLLVHAGDIKDYSANLLRLIEDAGLRERLGQNLRLTVSGIYSQQAVLESYRAWLEQE